MRTVFLSAGHSNGLGKLSKDRGAAYAKYVEGDLTIEFRDMFKAELQRLGLKVITDDNSNALLQTMKFFKTLLLKDSVNIDIHFNSGSTPNTATGVEVFIKDLKAPYPSRLASLLCNVTANVLGIKNRGVKDEISSHRGKLGWLTLTGTNILMEMCFINNDTDMRSWTTYKSALAKDLAKNLIIAL